MFPFGCYQLFSVAPQFNMQYFLIQGILKSNHIGEHAQHPRVDCFQLYHTEPSSILCMS